MATKKPSSADRLRKYAAGNNVDTRQVRRALRALNELGLSGARYDVEGPYGKRSILVRCQETLTKP